MSPSRVPSASSVTAGSAVARACVLYELLTGRRAFDGETTSDTIAAVLEHEPEWDQLPSAMPGAVRRLLQRCLDKNPRRRLNNIGAVRILVEDALAALELGGEPAGRRGTGTPRLGVDAAAQAACSRSLGASGKSRSRHR